MSRALTRAPAPVWIALIWAIAVFPNLTVRSFIWEEGTNAELARDILRRGDLLEPAAYGFRHVEKPYLLSWLIAAASQLTGGVNEWSARLPSMLAVLLTALLVERLTRRYTGAPASLFAAVSFMFCPLVLRKLTIGEPDTVVTFLSFAAFVLWWRGEETVHAATWRWLACGALLALLTMAKGPQPAAFFALGVGGYLVARGRLATPGLALCLALPATATIAWATTVYRANDLPKWLAYMRLGGGMVFADYLRERVWFAGGLLVDLLPGTILLPFLFIAWRRREPSFAATARLIFPLLLFAGLCTLALLVWPGARTRYAMPAAPAVAVLAALAFDSLTRRNHPVARLAVAIVAILFAYQVVLATVVMPLFAERFGATRNSGLALDRAISAAPVPVFTIGGPHSNQLFYVSHPIRRIDDLSSKAITAPAWLLAPSADIMRFERARPDLAVHTVVATSAGPGLVAARLEPRSRGP
jgi:4-amino-4-deoxy-L-arabinose transferase-like glycosyltransferase